MTALHELTGQFLELANNEDLPAEAIRDTLEAMEGDIKTNAASLADWALDICLLYTSDAADDAPRV